MRRFFSVLLFLEVSLIINGQIIADHTVVDKYDDIPLTYINEVKKMLVEFLGESHSSAYRSGLHSLEAVDSKFQVEESNPPVGYTNSYLRTTGMPWGDVSHETGWMISYGEEDWFTSALAISRTKAGITYVNTNVGTISAVGFAWCYDGSQIDMTTYLSATQEYIDYCNANNYSTKVIFTTGPVDGVNATGELGYNKHLAYEAIRNYVKAGSTRILFDYADIMCYDDGSATPNTTTWDGHTYPIITTKNYTPEYVGHVSKAAGIRLAKAQWWMLARIAGWNGGTTDIKDDFKNEESSVSIQLTGKTILIELEDSWSGGIASLISLQGQLIASKFVESDIMIFDTSGLASGIYLIRLMDGKEMIVEKVIIP